MNKSSRSLGFLFEIPLFSGRVNVSVFTAVAALCLFYADFSVYTLIIFGCILIHELSHIVTLKLCGGKIQKINLHYTKAWEFFVSHAFELSKGLFEEISKKNGQKFPFVI